MPGSQENQGDAGRLVEIEAVGNRDHIGCGNGDQLAVATIDGIAQRGEFTALILQSTHAFCAVATVVHWRQQNALAGVEPGDVFADFGDLSRDIASQDVRQFDSRQPLANPHIQMIERAGPHVHQDLIFSQLRIGNLFVS